MKQFDSHIRSQSAKPTFNIKPAQRQIQSAVPKPHDLHHSGQQIRPYSGVSTTCRNITSAKSHKSIATELIEIVPKEIVFNDIQPMQKQELFLTIRNLTKHPRRIRIQ